MLLKIAVLTAFSTFIGSTSSDSGLQEINGATKISNNQKILKRRFFIEMIFLGQITNSHVRIA